MILLTVGTQFPFDRLVRAVDDWAVAAGRDDVVGQIGPSSIATRRVRSFPFMDVDAFKKLQDEAQVIIAHAGMGSILTAMERGTPIVVMPRDHERGEHRNGHQFATATRFQSTPGVYVAMDETELAQRLSVIETLTASGTISRKAPQAFTDRLRHEIDTHLAPRPGLFSRLLGRKI